MSQELKQSILIKIDDSKAIGQMDALMAALAAKKYEVVIPVRFDMEGANEQLKGFGAGSGAPVGGSVNSGSRAEHQRVATDNATTQTRGRSGGGGGRVGGADPMHVMEAKLSSVTAGADGRMPSPEDNAAYRAEESRKLREGILGRHGISDPTNHAKAYANRRAFEADWSRDEQASDDSGREARADAAEKRRKEEARMWEEHTTGKKAWARDERASDDAGREAAAKAREQEERQAAKDAAAYHSGHRRWESDARDSDDAGREAYAKRQEEFRKGTEKVRAQSDKEDATEYAANIKASARAFAENERAVKKANSALSIWDKMWQDIGNGRVRGGVATGVTAMLKKSGLDNELAGGVGAFAGAFASSLALPLAWAAGNALMNILPQAMANVKQSNEDRTNTELDAYRHRNLKGDPGNDDLLRRYADQEDVYDLGGNARGSGRPRDRDGDKLLDLSAQDSLYMALHDTGISYKSAHQASEEFRQIQGYDRDTAHDRAIQFAAIAARSGEGSQKEYDRLTKSFAEIEKRPTQGGAGNFLDSNDALRDQAKKYFRDQWHIDPDTKQGSEFFSKWMHSEAITPEIMDRMVTNAGRDSKGALQILEGGRGQKPWLYQSHEDGPRGGTITGFDRIETSDRGSRAYDKYRAQKDKHDVYGTNGAVTAEYTYPNDVPGLQGGPDPVRSQERLSQQYSLTSFSGLAEQMQQMWSGVPIDANTQSLDSLKVSVDNLNATIAGGSGGARHPAGMNGIAVPPH